MDAVIKLLYNVIPLSTMITGGLGFIIPSKDCETEFIKKNKYRPNPPLTKKQFEAYLCKERPYLNPNLKITDLAISLSTNRTYLSGFINRVYGISFRQLINLYRLKEADRLGLSSDTDNITNIAQKAGFGCYRSYLRTKNSYRYTPSYAPIVSIIMRYAISFYKNVISISSIREADKQKDAKIQRLNKEQFEQYIRENKPYLNPKLKITDMTLPLYTNRTYLSSFINSNYGMSFNQFINKQRKDELSRLQEDDQYHKYSERELASMAGFSNYRCYLRLKTQE